MDWASTKNKVLRKAFGPEKDEVKTFEYYIRKCVYFCIFDQIVPSAGRFLHINPGQQACFEMFTAQATFQSKTREVP